MPVPAHPASPPVAGSPATAAPRPAPHTWPHTDEPAPRSCPWERIRNRPAASARRSKRPPKAPVAGTCAHNTITRLWTSRDGPHNRSHSPPTAWRYQRMQYDPAGLRCPPLPCRPIATTRCLAAQIRRFPRSPPPPHRIGHGTHPTDLLLITPTISPTPCETVAQAKTARCGLPTGFSYAADHWYPAAGRLAHLSVPKGACIYKLCNCLRGPRLAARHPILLYERRWPGDDPCARPAKRP